MKKESLNNIHFPYQPPWKLGEIPPADIYFTDQALPPDGHIDLAQALSVDDSVEENLELDCSDLLRGLWPEVTKEWFVWDESEKSLAIKIAVDVEELCGDFDVRKWWWEKVEEFVKFKVAYDKRKAAGKYVDPLKDWPFDLHYPREVSLPGDLPAIYALLCRFHDWMPGFDLLFSEGDQAVVEFLYSSSRYLDIDYEKKFEQRSVRVLELEEFLESIKQDIEENCVCRQADDRKIPDEHEENLVETSIPVSSSQKQEPEAQQVQAEQNIARNKDVQENTSAETSKPKQQQLSASRQLALDSFVQALCENEVLVKDKLADIYNWIMDLENLQNDKNPYKGVKEKPGKKTWKSYLRQACKNHGTSTDEIREKVEKNWLFAKDKGHDVVYAKDIDYRSSQSPD